MKFEFYCLANNRSGYGHLNRCLTLGKALRKKKWECNYNVIGNSTSINIIKDFGFSGKSFLSFSSLKNDTCSKKNKTLNSRIAILDISHESVLSNKKQLIEWIKFLKKNFFKIIIIDTIGDKSISNFIKKSNFIIDILIIPYVSNISLPLNANKKLFGPKFFIFSKYYSKLKKRKININVRNILITCGGSDPKNITLAILSSLIKIDVPLNIRVIFGPFYTKSLINKIKNLKKLKKHKISYYQSPLHLCNHMVWSDLTISTSGLSKYELALTGTPSLLISIDKLHHKINLPFSKLKSSINLGIFQNKNDYLGKFDKILNDYNTRKNLSINGQIALDALGTHRIIKEISNLNFK
jgi:UDP-2,4-diacetamido-2,4,6-trideoxy-beta-L-altropyranose hydrolase